MFSVIMFVLSLGLIAADQFIKMWAVDYLMPISTMPVIKGILDFTYVENYGAAFGIFQNQKWLLIGITSVVLLVFLFLLATNKIKEKPLAFAMSLIIAGGAGNLIDRVIRGFVVDYIDINQLFAFPMFNLADCCVCIGAAILIVWILFFEDKKNKSDIPKLTEEKEQHE